ncbi:hypothetical protein Clacol_001973 [Clathrus columnatus]|uniref:HNH nuclease domain-containing protein n=1 Tax=Clathrus columnatus TaxID=1419009 RepID=A0AAV5A527_9AGAM|nr:hypothetical protein Clacol_001973 [Clathrus columnatus]
MKKLVRKFSRFSLNELLLQQIFHVQTSPNETISQLRVKIWDENRHECSHAHARNLVLCVPTKPVSTVNQELFKAQLSQLQNGKAFVEELSPSSTVAKSGLSQPVEGQLHLFIMILPNKSAILLNCLVHGGEPGFRDFITVRASPDETVWEFQKKIWEDVKPINPYFSANSLTLYIPTTPIPIADKDTFKTQLAQSKVPVGELHLTLINAQSRLPQPMEGHFDVVVVIPPKPPQSEITGLKPEEAALWRLLVNVILLAPEKSSTGTERADNAPFKLELYRFYYDPGAERYPEMLTCSLTGVSLPSKAVIAAHLWPHSKGMSWEWFGLTNIDDPRNGLLLYKPIEEEFDRHNLCFYQAPDGKFRCRVLCETLKDKTFNDSFSKHKVGRTTTGIEAEVVQQAVPILAAKGYTTFRDLEKPEAYLQFPLTNPGPFKRVLNFHAVRAYILAKERGDTALQNFDLKDFYSDEEGYGAKNVIEAWRRNVAASLSGMPSSMSSVS